MTTSDRLPFGGATQSLQGCDVIAEQVRCVAGIVRFANLKVVLSIEIIVGRASARYVLDLGITPAPLADDYRARVAAGDAFVTLLGNVAVDPNVRNEGYGTTLLAFVETLAASWHERIARNARLGYRETHRARIGQHARVFMRKAICT